MPTQRRQVDARTFAHVTVHGRFQPPVHRNQWIYVKTGFDWARHVSILITNPDGTEGFDATASWRNTPESNPFTFDERRYMLRRLFGRLNIPPHRYTILPFNIKDPASFERLDPMVPNLVNVYSDWSSKKVELFVHHKRSVIQLEQPKTVPVSGTTIRQIIAEHEGSPNRLGPKLVRAGFLPEAIPGLVEVLQNRANR